MLLKDHIAAVPAGRAVRPGLVVAPWAACVLGALAIHFGFDVLLAARVMDAYWVGVLEKVGAFVIAAVSLNIVNGYCGQFSMGHGGFMAVGGYVAAAITFYGSLLIHGTVGDPAFYTGGVVLMLTGAVAGALVAAGLGYVVGLPSLRLRGDYLAIVTLGFGEIIRVLLTLSQNQLNSGVLTGVRDIVGEQPASVLKQLVMLAPRLPDPAVQPPVPIVRPTAEAVQKILPDGGASLSPARMQSLLDQISTTDASQLRALWEAPVSTLAGAPLGGSTGFIAMPAYATLFWVYLLVGITLVVAYRLKQSSSGRALLSIREDEIAARAMGVNLTFNKVRAFVLAAFFGGLAGAVLSHGIANPSPTDAGFQRSFDIIIFVVLGGLGSISGAALAAVVLTVMSEVLRGPQDFIPLWWAALIAAALCASGGWAMRALRRPGASVFFIGALVPVGLIALALVAQALKDWQNIDLSNYRMIVYALMLIGMMLVRPKGLFGVREIWDSFRRTSGAPPNDPLGPAPVASAMNPVASRGGGGR